jgi:hypothetical protein
MIQAVPAMATIDVATCRGNTSHALDRAIAAASV